MERKDKVIKRYYTKDKPLNTSVYQMFDWKKSDIEIKNQKTGDIIYSQKDCEFPSHYSQTASEIIASKYFFRAVPETSLKQVVHRMVSFWTEGAVRMRLIKTEEEREIFYDELAYTLLSQMWAPNSPQWFNTGIRLAYGIKGDPDEQFYYNPKSGSIEYSQDRYTRTQASACFILDIKDKLLGPGSITDHYVNETKLFKGGSGVGTNFSSLRAEGESLSSGGTSSGLMSYLEGLDRNAGAIKSGGTTRRAAKMVIVDIDHPEIEAFIDWKKHEEKKAKALIEAGYDGSIGGEAYSTVSGQNSNNSVRVDDNFMRLLDIPGSTIELKGRVDESINRRISVEELWDKIAVAAWECGDPAIQFDDAFNYWNTCKESGKINATNPCSEFAFLDNSACNLASINVYKFLDKSTKTFDVLGFKHLIGIIQTVLDISIEFGQFPTEEVARNSYWFRPTGLGIANLSSLLLALELPYDSPEARQLAGALSSLMTGWSYVVSAAMADKIGAFYKWDENRKSMAEVLERHKVFTEQLYLDNSNLINILYEARESWNIIDDVKERGFRNAQVTVMAPTGTISLAMDCGATGIEPFYSHKTYKKCADGSFIETVNPLLEEFIKDEGSLTEFEDNPVFHTASQISPEGHVKMMSAIQPFISGSISKTVNLPNTATPEDIKNIYQLAYELGCKSIAIYRDGSKNTQPLTTVKEKKDKINNSVKSVIKAVAEMPEKYKDPTVKMKVGGKTVELKETKNLETFAKDTVEMVQNIESKHSIKRKQPEGIRHSKTHSAKIGDIELYITISYYPDGKMAELFVSSDRDGTVVKGLLTAISKLASHLLQYDVDPLDISRALRNQKFEPMGPVSRHPYIKFADSISDLIAKIIEIECGDYSRCQVKPQEIKELSDRKDITDETIVKTPTKIPNKFYKLLVDQKAHQLGKKYSGERIYGERCPTCESDNLIKSGTCKTCLACGSTTGCG